MIFHMAVDNIDGNFFNKNETKSDLMFKCAVLFLF